MAVLINRKICDNASECGGIEICPTGALFWDVKGEKIEIDNNLCISCKQCESACPVGAIRVAENQEEMEKIDKEISEDKRTVEMLFVERYGAMPIADEVLVTQEEVDKFVDSGELVFIEQFQDCSIQCLLHSIPVAILREKYECIYKKQEVSNECSEEYPRLLIYNEGQLIGTISKYYEENELEEFLTAISKCMKK